MTRTELDQHIRNTYGVLPERLFPKYPTFAIYRRNECKKWFAVIMELSPDKLGLEGSSPVTVVNLKVDPLLGEILRGKSGFYPAYHMNKINWISAIIDDQTDQNELFGLIAMSHRLIQTKSRR